jgi:hypothetical protein
VGKRSMTCATALMSNHSEFDDAYFKAHAAANRKPGEPNPFDVSTDCRALFHRGPGLHDGCQNSCDRPMVVGQGAAWNRGPRCSVRSSYCVAKNGGSWQYVMFAVSCAFCDGSKSSCWRTTLLLAPFRDGLPTIHSLSEQHISNDLLTTEFRH